MEKDIRQKLDFVNYDLGMEYCAEDEEFYVEMIQAFVEGDKREQIETFFKNKDYVNYRVLVHALKGTSLSIGADVFSDEAKAQEKAAGAGNIEFVLEHHTKLMQDYGELLDRLQNFLGSL